MEENNSLYYQFADATEFITYVNLYKDKLKSQVYWAKGDDYTELFKKASSLFDEGKHNEAIDTLRTALEYNPIGFDARFELVENYIVLKDLNKATEELMELSKMLSKNTYIARFYRRLGYILIEEQKYEAAYACFIKSKTFEETQQANNEIAYIRTKTKIGLMFSSDRTLLKNNIPVLKSVNM